MKFLHTADWHLGISAAQAGEAGERIRQERLKAAARVVAAASEAGAEFVLVAGDMFDDNGVERIAVQQAGDLLARCGIPAFIIPGNHDPLVPGSVWDHPVWQAANIHLLREASPFDAGPAMLYPCPLKEAHGRRDPTGWITPAGRDRIRIGIAHGTVEGVPLSEPDFPIPRNAAERAGLDYIALGHWHSLAEYQNGEGVVRMAYCGAHEATKFGERESGKALIVEVESPGAPPVIQPIQTGGLAWRDLSFDLRTPGQIEEVASALNSIERPDSVLLSLHLTGLIFAGDLARFEQLRDIVDSNRFLFARLHADGLRPAPEDSGWIDALPPGILREAASRLREWADPGFQGVRPEAATPQTAANALIELYALAREVGA